MTEFSASFWSSIELSWQRCLDLAWEDYVAASVPVGSVLTAPDGGLVAEARESISGTGWRSSPMVSQV